MNQWQIAQQIRYMLENRKWDDNALNSVIFGKVIVSNKSIEDLIRQAPRQPFAAVRMGAMTNDADFPEMILDMGLEVDIAVRVENDPYGQSDLVGGVRLDLATSQGRGLGEVVYEVQGEMKANFNDDGVSMYSIIRGAASAVEVANRFWSVQTVDVVARGGIFQFYHPARNLVNTAGTLSWTLPPDRFDRQRVVLRYASGSTPPASVTAGSGATLASDLATSYVHGTDLQGSGTFSYALFAQYDFVGSGTVAQFQTSASVTLTDSF